MSEHLVLRILQYNVNKSKDRVMIPLFKNPLTPAYDILAIQEPWRNPFQHTTNHWLAQHFELSYFPHKKTRVCFFINKRLALSSWSVTIHSIDFSTLKLKTNDDRIIHIHNVYNPCQTSGNLSRLGEIQKVLQEFSRNIEHILLGDFNLHHPLWGGTEVEAEEDAEKLIMLTEKARLKQVLPPGTITWQRHESKSTLDLVFLSPLLQESLLECRKSTLSESHSDHEPIRTVISLSTIEAKPHQIRNWNKTDISLLRQKLDVEFRESSALYPDMSGSWDNTNQGLDSQIEAIISAIQNAIHASTPWVKIVKGGCLEASQLITNHYYLERKRDAQREWTKLRFGHVQVNHVQVNHAPELRLGKSRRLSKGEPPKGQGQIVRQ